MRIPISKASLARSGISFLLAGAISAWGSDYTRVADAVQHKDRAGVRSLLSRKADVNAPQEDGATALAWAVYWDDLDLTDELIRAGADVNAANVYGVTPLSLACGNRNPAMVEKLLRARANPNVTENNGATPLMTCSNTGSADAVRSLLERGANVNARENRRSQTALMWAVSERHADVVKLLVDHGANVNASTMLNAASLDKFDNYAKAWDAQHRLKGGFTPLMFAARVGDLASTRTLVEGGAHLNDSTPEQGSALGVATASGNTDLALYLLQKGADPNIADDYGMTPLHHAVAQGISAFGRNVYSFIPNRPDLVKALLERGANPNARIRKNFEFNSRPDFDLATSMIGSTPFMLAAASADLGIMNQLIAAGADPLLTTEDGKTALMLSAELFVTRDIPGVVASKHTSPDEEKMSLDVASLIIKLGVNVNAVDKEGHTALYIAATMGEDPLIRLLVANGADLSIKDKKGQTALGYVETPGEEGEYAGRDHLKTTVELLRQLSTSR